MTAPPPPPSRSTSRSTSPATSQAAADGRRLATANAVLANGRMLVTLSARGEVEQVVWPHLDRDRQLASLRLGVIDGGHVRWLDEDARAWRQRAAVDARVVTTEIDLDDGTRVTIVDAVDPEHDVLLREVTTGGHALVVAAVPSIGAQPRTGAAHVDPVSGAVVSYRRDQALALLTDAATVAGVGEPRRGTSAIDDLLASGQVGGDALAHGVHDVAIVTVPGDRVRLAVALAHDPAHAVAGARAGLAADVAARRTAADAALLDGCHAPVAPAGVDVAALTALYRASVLAVDSMTDVTGAVLAGPEVDLDFLQSGGYGFVWSRDLAMIVRALLAAGRRDAAVAALHWLAATQGHDGLWAQRQWSDGLPAPCWGVQLDETGAVLHAFGVALDLLGDNEVDLALWHAIRRGADALVRFRNLATGLPLPSVDLWEERTGTHAFTAAACAAGLRAAAAAAVRHDDGEAASRWAEAADTMVAALHEHFWDEHLGRYVRSRWVGRADTDGSPLPAGFHPPDGHVLGRFGSVDDVDPVVDVSLLGLLDPFEVVAADDPRMRATLDAVETHLRTSDGGILRYEGDEYVGGNPWILTTLWLGAARRKAGDDGAEVARALSWTLARQTSTGLLPEQVDEATGAPTWVVPLSWSHAMVLLAARP